MHHIFILGQTDPIINPESSPLIIVMSYKKNKNSVRITVIAYDPWLSWSKHRRKRIS